MKAPKRKSYHHKYLHTTGQLWWEDQDLLCVPLPLPGPANICLPNVCSSISISIAFFSFEDPDRSGYLISQPAEMKNVSLRMRL